MRRTIIAVLATLAIVAGLGAVAMAVGGGSTVTRPRLERSLPHVFSNVYADQARMLGRKGITPASLHAKAMCDKHGPDVADVGPGGDWVCLMSWTDPNVPMPPEGYAKFELNVHSNGCYTVGSPSKYAGYLTLTDIQGREVTNPLFEFDGCFDPASSNTPTGIEFPSVLSVTSTALNPDPQGRVGLQVGCGTGSQGCAGTITAKAGATTLGTVPFQLKEESTKTLAFPTPVPGGVKEVSFEVTTTTGYSSSDPVTLSVQ